MSGAVFIFGYKKNAMINQDAVRLLDHFYAQPSFFTDNQAAFIRNAEEYALLKRQFHEGPVTSNPAFQRHFARFYGMRFVPAAGKNAFFQKMELLRNDHEGLGARLLTEELQPLMGQYHFSFTTKMLNLLDDETYPIYDSQIATVFQTPFLPDETRLDHQEAIYRDVTDTYQSLRQHPVIDAFRTRFNCPEMGTMKVLDAIFWRLGKILGQDAAEPSAAEYLDSLV